MVSFTPQPSYPAIKTPRTLSIGDWAGPGRGGEGNKYFHCPAGN